VSRIDAVFQKNGIPAFIGFTVAGDPDPETSVRIGKALIDAGTDILELGMPFSDPVADGPTIQKADERAFAAGTTPDTVFTIVRELRAYSDVPIVILSYFNMGIPAWDCAVLLRGARRRRGWHSRRGHAG
jgi:tryptophan synthase alpha chain